MLSLGSYVAFRNDCANRMLKAISQTDCLGHLPCKGIPFLKTGAQVASLRLGKLVSHASVQQPPRQLHLLRFHKTAQARCRLKGRPVILQAGSRAFVFSSDAEDDDAGEAEETDEVFLDAADEDLDTGRQTTQTCILKYSAP